jgi:predicted adenine nucleotide alpha hydrolase (AANH) superfamily ATPase
MCRAKTAGNRRCKCDTSEKRKLRRYNKAARETSQTTVTSTIDTEPKYLPSIAKKEGYTVKSIRKEIEFLHSIGRDYKKGKGGVSLKVPSCV